MLRIQKLALICVSALALIGCREAVGTPKAIVHAKVDTPGVQIATVNSNGSKATPSPLKDSSSAGIHRVTLSPEASKRLGIQFADVTAGDATGGIAAATSGTPASDPGAQLPYNALLYDASGGEWVFVSPAPNVYMRTAVKVERIDGDKVMVSKGPAPGSKVVTMGAAELYGIEFGVGK